MHPETEWGVRLLVKSQDSGGVNAVIFRGPLGTDNDCDNASIQPTHGPSAPKRGHGRLEILTSIIIRFPRDQTVELQLSPTETLNSRSPPHGLTPFLPSKSPHSTSTPDLIGVPKPLPLPKSHPPIIAPGNAQWPPSPLLRSLPRPPPPDPRSPTTTSSRRMSPRPRRSMRTQLANTYATPFFAVLASNEPRRGIAAARCRQERREATDTDSACQLECHQEEDRRCHPGQEQGAHRGPEASPGAHCPAERDPSATGWWEEHPHCQAGPDQASR